MNLAVCQMAWPRELEEAAAALLQSRGVCGVEVAPTAIWPDPLASTTRERSAYRRAWERRGIAIVALQALLYGRPELALFAGRQARSATADYLVRLIEVAVDLGAQVLVFGSPSHRRLAGLRPGEANEIAAGFFAAIGRAAHARGVQVCIEPIPRAWGCEFVNTIQEGLALVERVGSAGFGLHLDTASAAQESDAAAAIEAAGGAISHVHASEPNLAPLGTSGLDHAVMGAALRRAGYAAWVSLEMRATTAAGALDRVDEAIRHARVAYARR